MNSKHVAIANTTRRRSRRRATSCFVSREFIRRAPRWEALNEINE
jgi:hypothetical protein